MIVMKPSSFKGRGGLFRRFFFRRAAALAAAALFFLPAAARASLPASVATALHAAGIPAANVAVVVRDAGTGRLALSHNASVPLNPASVMKLVTTYAGLDLLGPAYRWKTEIYTAGARTGDTLRGQLVLKGFGDPRLTLEDFWRVLLEARERGLRDLEGDLVLDGSYFARSEPFDSGRFDDKPLRPYNVGPDALLLNFKSVNFQFVPLAQSGAVRVIAEPHPPSLTVVNALRLAPGACGEEWTDALGARFEPEPVAQGTGRGQVRALFAGTYPESCGEKDWNVALFSHRAYVAGVFGLLWGQLGGTWHGDYHEGVLPEGAQLLLRHESPPLAEIIRDINKFSNNLMARQLFLTLGAESAGPPAREAEARQAVLGWLAKRRIAAPGLVIDNGSGLSRTARISADTLARLLLAAYADPLMPEFIASLPLAAVDGTMKKRMNGESIAGEAHVKTGSLADVRAIAGYVPDRKGRLQAVVMIVNDPGAARAQPALEALLRWTYDRRAD